MRIDFPQCNFKNCRYSFDGNCTNRDKYKCCDYRFAKVNAVKEFTERLKREIDTISYETGFEYQEAIDVIDGLTKEMMEEQNDE